MEQLTPANQEIGLRKAKRKGLKQIYAVRVLPPDFVLDESGGEDHQYKFFYTSKNYKACEKECTKHVWRRSEGRTGPGVIRDGFDALSSDYDFILHEDPTMGKEGMIVGVDLIPATTYNAKRTAPLDVQGYDYIELAINASTGEIEFIAVPVKVTKLQLQNLIKVIDKLELIQAGDVLGNQFSVYEIHGNRLKIAPPVSGGGAPRTPGQVGI